jgi:hypothetical protein
MPNLDFASIMADLTQFQNAVGRIHSQLTDPRQKEVLGEALDNVAKSRADVERIYPKTIKQIEDHAQGTIREAEATRQQIQQKQQWLEQLKQQGAQAAQAGAMAGAAASAIPAAAPQPPIELHPAAQLRDELLSRFQPKSAAPKASPLQFDHEIWEDWNWGGTQTVE